MRRYPVLVLSSLALVCVLLFTAGTSGATPANVKGTEGGASAANGHNAVAGSNGPTVLLSYADQNVQKNPIESFMYFIPLLSRSMVHKQTSANNEEMIGIISYQQKSDSKAFFVDCEFEIQGSGFHKYIFEPDGMIAIRTRELKKDQSLSHALDYIKFEGDGFGRIEVKGTIDGVTETVTAVNLKFNSRGHKSPVTIGLYDIEPEDGKYAYENRSNVQVARVNALRFTRTDEIPRMGISVASVTKGTDGHGLLASVKGAMANLLLNPPKIDEFGNETMLDFGRAIRKQAPEFTFPRAKNINENVTVVGVN
jgi:hypothetical protein